jgi:hypothetical protein
VEIALNEDDPQVANLLDTLQRQLTRRPSAIQRKITQKSTIRLNVVIHVVGSRGDVQPFVRLGQELKRHGHRVRLATHEIFRDFVKNNGLEFFNIGGDPAELMSFMVKNPKLIPKMETLMRGSIGRRRKEIRTMIGGCWRSCIEAGEGDMMSDDAIRAPAFVADAIIANPPSFAHIHCAEKLGIPLHLMFTLVLPKQSLLMYELMILECHGHLPWPSHIHWPIFAPVMQSRRSLISRRML